ncbi:hypothetical protein C8255_20370 [filamentous cyanobacterium CCP3]|nr:hypothetical protein C8255_20370 [filamentous cyanobacterium CCP3]
MVLSGLFQTYRNNWRRLRDELSRLGAEVEQWSYADLNRPAEAQPPIHRLVAGVPAYFQIDSYDHLPSGDLTICIDAHGGPPTPLGIKPSYHFYKRRDGSVYY